MKRHQILGKELHTSLDECLRCLAITESKLAEAIAAGRPQADWRAASLNNAVTYAVLEHLGYGAIDDLPARLEGGVDAAVEFFFGRWWVHEQDAQGLDKALGPNRARMMWLPLLPDIWLLCGLTGRWRDLARICSWFDDTEAVEGMMQDDDYMYLCIASDLRPEPISGVAKLRARWQATRRKRLRLLSAAWEAALASDQIAFDKAFKESVAHFLKADAEDVPNPNFWVAVLLSFAWLMAERNGLSFPKLPERLDAAIVRRETIGLDRPSPHGA